MPTVVTEDFLKSIRSSPDGQRKNGTIFDELYTSLETSENPLDNAIDTIAEFHGPWSGGSAELTDFNVFLASKLNNSSLKNQAMQSASDTINVNSAINNIDPSSRKNYNKETIAIMPTPLMREFINRSQKMHPAINMYIQNNIGSFPYYQQTSEDVGQYASKTMQRTSIDPISWPLRNGSRCLDTNSLFNINTILKMASNVATLMDDANNLTNTMFLRSMPKQNNMSFMHPSYSSEAPISHGHNFTMDVHNAKREKQAIAPCMSAVIQLAGDVLRLLNKFFCIKELARYNIEGFQIVLNEGPHREPITYIVDNNGMPMNDNDKPNNITDPTNAKTIGTKEKHKEEQD